MNNPAFPDVTTFPITSITLYLGSSPWAINATHSWTPPNNWSNNLNIVGNPNFPIVSNQYVSVKIKLPNPPTPDCATGYGFRLQLQSRNILGNWYNNDHHYFGYSVVHPSQTNGTINGHPPGVITTPFAASETITLDMSSSTCEIGYYISMKETDASWNEIPGTYRSETVFSQAPSNVNLNSWTAEGMPALIDWLMIINESNNRKYFQVKIATNPDWDEKIFRFSINPLCKELYISENDGSPIGCIDPGSVSTFVT